MKDEIERIYDLRHELYLSQNEVEICRWLLGKGREVHPPCLTTGGSAKPRIKWEIINNLRQVYEMTRSAGRNYILNTHLANLIRHERQLIPN